MVHVGTKSFLTQIGTFPFNQVVLKKNSKRFLRNLHEFETIQLFSGMAQEMFQVQRLQQNVGLNNRMRWPRPRCLLQNVLRQEMGSSRLRIRLWFWILTDRRIKVTTMDSKIIEKKDLKLMQN